MTMRRLLITGSRTWDDVPAIAYRLLPTVTTFGSQVVLVSGHCPLGADAICERFADMFGWTIERHPADWNKYGKAAGFRRNAEMVNLGANECLAFIRDNSRGATGTAKLAVEAGIPTQCFRYDKISRE